MNAESDRSRALSSVMLAAENREFAGTVAVSQNALKSGFKPAFRDAETGRTELARFANGREAPMHLIEGLPVEWALEVDAEGRPATLKDTIASGFVKGDCFYTREELASGK